MNVCANRLFGGLIAAVFLTAGVSASELRTSPPDSLPGLELRTGDGAVLLNLDEAVEIAVQRNLGLLAQRYDRAQFQLRIDQSSSIYDLGLQGDVSASESTEPAASNLDGADIVTRENQSWNARMQQLTPWGGTLRAAFTNARAKSNSSFVFFNPNFFSGLSATFTQPLLRNRGRIITDRPIKLARINSSISLQTLEQQVVSTVQLVENAYWTLVEARAQLDVAKESLALAKELHQMNRVRVDVGTLAPLELVTSEAGIATREEQIIRAEGAVGDAEDELRRLLNLPQGRLWDQQIVPDSDPKTDRIEPVLSDAIAQSLEDRPELVSKKLELASLELDAHYFRNQRLPDLSLAASYGLSGLGGDLLAICDAARVAAGECSPSQLGQNFVVSSGGWGDALSQVADRDFDNWTITLSVTYPLQNRNAKAQSAIAKLALEQGRLELEELEQRINTEVRRAVRGVQTASKTIESAGASRKLSEKNVEAERKRYENGLVTSFQVLEVQEDLTDARSREVAAITGYRKALVEYYRSVGGLLDAVGVELSD